MQIQMQMQGAAQLLTMLRMAPDIATKHLRWATEKSVMLLQREIAEATPTGAHQLLRKSIVAQPVVVSQLGVSGIVGTSSNYAIPVEIGTRPHFPPLAPLRDWAIAKLGVDKKQAGSVAFLIARKISKKGTKGAYMFRDTFTRLEPAINSYFEQARQSIIAEMAAQGKP